MTSQLYHKFTLPANLMDARLDGEFANVYSYLGTLPGFPLLIANGGTNSSTALSNHRIMISLGGKIVETTALTAATLLQADSNGLPVSLALGTAYQIVGMNSGATANIYLTLAGTTSQIIIGTSGSTITLSTPQNIATGSNPTFSGLTLSGLNSVGIVHTNSSGVFSTSLVVNADVNAAAAIAYSKLNLSGSIVNADVATGAAIAYAKLNLSTSIVNADVNASAAIAVSKLAALTASRNVKSDGSGFLTTGAVTLSSINDVTGTLPVANGGTGQTALSAFVPTVQKFTSGSGTYTTPAGVTWIKVTMAGGGGQGAGGGTGSPTAGSNGTASTFGTSLLTANGGTGGLLSSTGSAAGGGSVTVNSPAIDLDSVAGGQGQGKTSTAIAFEAGGMGGSSALGGAGAGSANAGGNAGAANSGGGGAGGGVGAAGANPGGGAGAGGTIRAIIPGPSATYGYVVGPGGSAAGAAGTNGFAGGAGGSGGIVIEEHYI